MEDEYWSKVLRLASHIECKTIFDVGAHRGGTTEWFLANFPRAEIHAFEPDPRNFPHLREKLGHLSQVVTNHAALTDQVGEMEFNLGENTYTSSLFPREADRRRYFAREFIMIGTDTVPTDTLDNYCQRTATLPDIVKLDTQGAEAAIIRGAENLLRNSVISIIASEFFFIQHYQGVPLLNDIWTLLRSHGYELYDLFKGPYGSNGQVRFGDAIFVSPTFRRNFLDSAPDEV